MEFNENNIVIVCIGSVNNVLDSLGPRVGSYLKEHTNIEVYGTVDNPIHALNLHKFLKTFHPKGKTVIGIDASIGQELGKLVFRKGPIRPGSGVKKSLPEVGDYSLRVIVATSEYELFLCQDEREVLGYVQLIIRYLLNLIGG